LNYIIGKGSIEGWLMIEGHLGTTILQAD